MATDEDVTYVSLDLEKGMYIIEETSRETSASNLQLFTDMFEDSYGINGSIRVMMKSMSSDMHFVVGPITHKYYSSAGVESMSYENDRLELSHPDLKPGYTPIKNARSMRKIHPISSSSKTKKGASASASSAYASSASAPAAKKDVPAPTKKRAATVTKATKKPIYETNPVATAALQAALDSAQDGDGVVDPKCLKKALAQGYSKVYIDAKVDERRAH